MTLAEVVFHPIALALVSVLCAGVAASALEQSKRSDERKK
jgi:hypothetical protein